MIDLSDILVKSCDAGVFHQNEKGAFPSGINGPHQHNMTPVRNTAHWSVALAESYRLTGSSFYLDALDRAIRYITSETARPMEGAFWKRKENQKSSFNGLIGQCWCLESLIFCGEVLGDKTLIALASDVFEMHEFDSTLGLWFQLDLDGSAADMERTLNQQVWMASIAAWLSQHDSRFTNLVNKFLGQFDNYVVRYGSLYPRALINTSSGAKNRVRDSFLALNRFRENQRNIEYGYHIFTICGLARIFEKFGSHEFFEKNIFKNRLRFSFSEKFSYGLDNSVFGFQYNVPGFESLYIYDVFRDYLTESDRDFSSNLCLAQIGRHYDYDKRLLSKNSVDPETLSARIYEVYRIPEYLRKL